MREKEFEAMPENYKWTWLFRRVGGMPFSLGTTQFLIYLGVVNFLLICSLAIFMLATYDKGKYAYMIGNVMVLLQAAYIFIWVTIADMVVSLVYMIWLFFKDRKLLKRAGVYNGGK